MARRGPKTAIALLLIAGCAARYWERGEPVGLSKGPAPGATEPPDELALAEPERHRREGYVSSEACRACHPKEYATWRASFHRKMTQRATSDAVLPPWKHDTVLRSRGRTYRLLRRDEAFWVDMPRYGTTGVLPEDRMERPVVMTTGSHHLQLFWIAVPWVARDDAQGRRAYRKRCASCHGLGPSTPLKASLRRLDLRREDVLEALEREEHPPALEGAGAGERREIVEFVERLQLPGRLSQFPLAWSVEQKRWVHEDDTFVGPPEEPSPVERFEQHWRDACDQCHSVAPRLRGDVFGVGGRAQIAELGIACEACHGPGRGHVERHEEGTKGTSTLPDVVNPAKLDHVESAAVCGQCHANVLNRGGSLAHVFRPGDRIEDHVDVLTYEEPPYPAWLAPSVKDDPNLIAGAFWADGTMRIAGRNYNGLAKTGCFERGELDCTSCHRLHGADPDDQLKDDAKGNAVCITCHAKIGGDVAAHTHHPADSPGSLCYGCHAPYTTLGLLKAIRSHRIDVPRARTSAETGRPNACNLCHLDTTLQQTADTLSAWYGQPSFRDEHQLRDVPAAVRWLLAGDAAQRSVAAWSFGLPEAQQASGTFWLAPFLARLLDDPYAAVRRIAERSLRTLPEGAKLDYTYDGSALSRHRAQAKVMRRWRARDKHPDKPEVWLTSGELDTTKLSSLTAQRDDTPIRIDE